MFNYSERLKQDSEWLHKLPGVERYLDLVDVIVTPQKSGVHRKGEEPEGEQIGDLVKVKFDFSKLEEDIYRERPCAFCDGDGFDGDDICTWCGGYGEGYYQPKTAEANKIKADLERIQSLSDEAKAEIDRGFKPEENKRLYDNFQTQIAELKKALKNSKNFERYPYNPEVIAARKDLLDKLERWTSSNFSSERPLDNNRKENIKSVFVTLWKEYDKKATVDAIDKRLKQLSGDPTGNAAEIKALSGIAKNLSNKGPYKKDRLQRVEHEIDKSNIVRFKVTLHREDDSWMPPGPATVEYRQGPELRVAYHEFMPPYRTRLVNDPAVASVEKLPDYASAGPSEALRFEKEFIQNLAQELDVPEQLLLQYYGNGAHQRDNLEVTLSRYRAKLNMLTTTNEYYEQIAKKIGMPYDPFDKNSTIAIDKHARSTERRDMERVRQIVKSVSTTYVKNIATMMGVDPTGMLQSTSGKSASYILSDMVSEIDRAIANYDTFGPADGNENGKVVDNWYSMRFEKTGGSTGPVRKEFRINDDNRRNYLNKARDTLRNLISGTAYEDENVEYFVNPNNPKDKHGHPKVDIRWAIENYLLEADESDLMMLVYKIGLLNLEQYVASGGTSIGFDNNYRGEIPGGSISLPSLGEQIQITTKVIEALEKILENVKAAGDPLDLTKSTWSPDSGGQDAEQGSKARALDIWSRPIGSRSKHGRLLKSKLDRFVNDFEYNSNEAANDTTYMIQKHREYEDALKNLKAKSMDPDDLANYIYACFNTKRVPDSLKKFAIEIGNFTDDDGIDFEMLMDDSEEGEQYRFEVHRIYSERFNDLDEFDSPSDFHNWMSAIKRNGLIIDELNDTGSPAREISIVIEPNHELCTKVVYTDRVGSKILCNTRHKTLEDLAKHYYNNPEKWWVIANRNAQLNPAVFTAVNGDTVLPMGLMVRIPPLMYAFDYDPGLALNNYVTITNDTGGDGPGYNTIKTEPGGSVFAGGSVFLIGHDISYLNERPVKGVPLSRGIREYSAAAGRADEGVEYVEVDGAEIAMIEQFGRIKPFVVTSKDVDEWPDIEQGMAAKDVAQLLLNANPRVDVKVLESINSSMWNVKIEQTEVKTSKPVIMTPLEKAWILLPTKERIEVLSNLKIFDLQDETARDPAMDLIKQLAKTPLFGQMNNRVQNAIIQHYATGGTGDQTGQSVFFGDKVKFGDIVVPLTGQKAAECPSCRVKGEINPKCSYCEGTGKMPLSGVHKGTSIVESATFFPDNKYPSCKITTLQGNIVTGNLIDPAVESSALAQELGNGGGLQEIGKHSDTNYYSPRQEEPEDDLTNVDLDDLLGGLNLESRETDPFETIVKTIIGEASVSDIAGESAGDDDSIDIDDFDIKALEAAMNSLPQGESNVRTGKPHIDTVPGGSELDKIIGTGELRGWLVVRIAERGGMATKWVYRLVSPANVLRGSSAVGYHDIKKREYEDMLGKVDTLSPGDLSIKGRKHKEGPPKADPKEKSGGGRIRQIGVNEFDDDMNKVHRLGATSKAGLVYDELREFKTLQRQLTGDQISPEERMAWLIPQAERLCERYNQVFPRDTGGWDNTISVDYTETAKMGTVKFKNNSPQGINPLNKFSAISKAYRERIKWYQDESRKTKINQRLARAYLPVQAIYSYTKSLVPIVNRMRALNFKIKQPYEVKACQNDKCRQEVILDPRKDDPFQCLNCGESEANRERFLGNLEGEVVKWSSELPGRGRSTRRQLIRQPTENMNLNYIGNIMDSVEDMKKEKDELWKEATSYVNEIINAFDALMLQPSSDGSGKKRLDGMLQTIKMGHAFVQEWTDIGNKLDIDKAMRRGDIINIGTGARHAFGADKVKRYANDVVTLWNKGFTAIDITDKLEIPGELVRWILMLIASKDVDGKYLKRPVDKYAFDFLTDKIWVKLSDDPNKNDYWTLDSITTDKNIERSQGQMASVRSLFVRHPYAKSNMFDPQVVFIDSILQLLFNSYLSSPEFVAAGHGLSARKGAQKQGYGSGYQPRGAPRAIRMTSGQSFIGEDIINPAKLLQMVKRPTVIVCGVNDKFSKYEGLTAKVLKSGAKYSKIKFNSLNETVYIKNNKLIIIDGDI